MRLVVFNWLFCLLFLVYFIFRTTEQQKIRKKKKEKKEQRKTKQRQGKTVIVKQNLRLSRQIRSKVKKKISEKHNKV